MRIRTHKGAARPLLFDEAAHEQRTDILSVVESVLLLVWQVKELIVYDAARRAYCLAELREISSLLEFCLLSLGDMIIVQVKADKFL